MAHEIILSITDEAQKVAARNGKPAAAVQHYALPAAEVSAALDLGATVTPSGDVRLLWAVSQTTSGYVRGMSGPLDIRPDDASHALLLLNRVTKELERKALAKDRATVDRFCSGATHLLDVAAAATRLGGTHLAAYEAEVRRREQDHADNVEAHVVAAVEAGPEAIVALHTVGRERWEIASHKGVSSPLAYPYGWKDSDDSRLVTLYEQAAALCKDRNETMELEARQRAASTMQLRRRWISEHAPALMPRFDDGVLPEKELRDAVRDVVFSSLDGFGRYRRITVNDVAAACDADTPPPCDNHEISFDVDVANELSAAEYDRLKAIEKAMEHPSVTAVEAREHRAEYEYGDGVALVVRRSARVSLDFLGFHLSREYALTDVEAA